MTVISVTDMAGRRSSVSRQLSTSPSQLRKNLPEESEATTPPPP
jgi:hypothetical protein